MKFIHTADIHLDSPLRGLASYLNAPVEMLRTATRDAFTNLINEAIDEQVDFMVIAGDLYDGNWKDYNTGHFFVREMGRLNKAGIPVYLLYGNHDAESEMTKRLTLPPNVHLFDSRKPVTHRIDALRVALHGRHGDARGIAQPREPGLERRDGGVGLFRRHRGRHLSRSPPGMAEHRRAAHRP